MSNPTQGKAAREINLGLRVERATAVLPDTAYGALFTITGGKVAIMAIVGELTIACDATATNLKLTATPTTGTAVDVATNVAVASKEIGCLLGVSAYAAALVAANAGATPVAQPPFIVNTGTLGLTSSATQVGSAKWEVLNIGTIDLDCAASNTGSVKWTLFYVPIDDGANIVAA